MTMDTLRLEAIEAQKNRSELLKWKLLIVAGVSGTALGFSGKGPGSSYLALAILPLCCAYVDLLCWNLSLRIKAIGLFILHGSHGSAELRCYERFYREIGQVLPKASLESLALFWSTLIVSLAVAPVGYLAAGWHFRPITWNSNVAILCMSSVAGVVLAFGIRWWCLEKLEAVKAGAVTKERCSDCRQVDAHAANSSDSCSRLLKDEKPSLCAGESSACTKNSE
jgi:hypothetical protein